MAIVVAKTILIMQNIPIAGKAWQAGIIVNTVGVLRVLMIFNGWCRDTWAKGASVPEKPKKK